MFEHVSIDLPKKLKRVEVDGKDTMMYQAIS